MIPQFELVQCLIIKKSDLKRSDWYKYVYDSVKEDYSVCPKNVEHPIKIILNIMEKYAKIN